MRNSILLLLGLIVVVSGCENQPQMSSGLESKVQEKIKLFSDAAPPAEKKPQPNAWLEADTTLKDEPRLMQAPNPVVDHWNNPLGELKDPKDMTVGMKIIDRHFDQKNVYFTVLLRNTADKGARVRLYAFGYDTNNRLLNTGDTALYIQPREQLLQKYSFNRGSGMTRWMLSLR